MDNKVVMDNKVIMGNKVVMDNKVGTGSKVAMDSMAVMGNKVVMDNKVGMDSMAVMGSMAVMVAIIMGVIAETKVTIALLVWEAKTASPAMIMRTMRGGSSIVPGWL